LKYFEGRMCRGLLEAAAKHDNLQQKVITLQEGDGKETGKEEEKGKGKEEGREKGTYQTAEQHPPSKYSQTNPYHTERQHT
jgi:hypothetical protein